MPVPGAQLRRRETPHIDGTPSNIAGQAAAQSLCHGLSVASGSPPWRRPRLGTSASGPMAFARRRVAAWALALGRRSSLPPILLRARSMTLTARRRRVPPGVELRRRPGGPLPARHCPPLRFPFPSSPSSLLPSAPFPLGRREISSASNVWVKASGLGASASAWET